MNTAAPGFYTTGGTLRPDAPSYVERRADRDLYEGLSHGDFCYVLTSRQMGKSSLMARTAQRLRQEGVAVVVLDLTAIGQNLNAEQWYAGLLHHLGAQLDLEDELDDFWFEQERFGPMHRWMVTLREVVLARVPGRVTIFLDEIDVVRSLPFSTDEFFAAIRQCYNRRNEDPEYARLAFCLLGAASPSDLIRDPRLTPFNIGQRIELTDFTVAEAAPLAAGLGGNGQADSLLHRILHWTNGHPYLTQRLCQAVATDGKVAGGVEVDRLCERLFLSPRAQERDDNLLFVRNWLLRSETDVASLLDVYRNVRRGRRVKDDETSLLVTILRLSGIVRSDAGALRIRNRIYERVFNPSWIAQQMPDAEVRRQRSAYRRGVARAAAVATVILVAMGTLALVAVRSDRAARRERDRVSSLLYAAQVNLAQRSWEEGNLAAALALLDAQRPRLGQVDRRGFEWRYLRNLCGGDARHTLRGHTQAVSSVALSPDGRTLASAASDATVKLWNLATRQPVATLRGHKGPVSYVTFAPDGNTLASAGDGLIRLWNVRTRREQAVLKPADGASKLAFSPDGRLLASITWDGPLRLWNLTTRREIGSMRGGVDCVAFSPDGRTLVAHYGPVGGALGFWNLATRRLDAVLPGHGTWVETVAFSPDGRTTASASGDRTAKLWDVRARRERATLRGHRAAIFTTSFSPDGRTLVTGSVDGTLKLWDVTTGQERSTLRGHGGHVTSALFTADGRYVVSGSVDHTIKLWEVGAAEPGSLILNQRTEVHDLALSPDARLLALENLGGTVTLWDAKARRRLGDLPRLRRSSFVLFSPDGRALVTGGDRNTVRLWEPGSRREIGVLYGHTGPVFAAAFTPDGSTLATGSGDRTVKLWDFAGRRQRATLKGHAREVVALAFSPDGRFLASGGRDRTVRLWDGVTGRSVGTLPGHTEGVLGLEFSRDGRLLAAGSLDKTVKLWPVSEEGRVSSPTTLRGHAAGVICVRFSPDDKTLASAGGDGTVQLWNVASRSAVATLQGHNGPVPGLAFSRDGSTLASGSLDWTVRLWHAAPPER